MSIFVFKNFTLLIAGPAAWAFLSSIRDLIKRKSCQEDRNTNHKIIFKIWRGSSDCGGFFVFSFVFKPTFLVKCCRAAVILSCPHVTVCTLFLFHHLPGAASASQTHCPTALPCSIIIFDLLCSDSWRHQPGICNCEAAFSVQMYWDDLCITYSQSKNHNANDKTLKTAAVGQP